MNIYGGGWGPNETRGVSLKRNQEAEEQRPKCTHFPKCDFSEKETFHSEITKSDGAAFQGSEMGCFVYENIDLSESFMCRLIHH